MHRSIKHHTNNNKSSGIKFIEIPTNETIPWNSIPLSLSKDQWKKIDNPKEIEKLLVSHNKPHLSQAQGTLFIITPLKYLLGIDSFTQFGDDICQDTANIDFLPLSKLQILHLSNLKKILGSLSFPLSHNISI